jgi:hypothetical protein
MQNKNLSNEKKKKRKGKILKSGEMVKKQTL